MSADTRPWYELRLVGASRPTRRYRADDDQVALALALGLVRSEIRRRQGAGVRWNLHVLAAGLSSPAVRRVDG